MLNVANAGRQKVKLATKLFSHTNSAVISRIGSLGYLQDESNWIEVSEFFKLVSEIMQYVYLRRNIIYIPFKYR